MAETTGPIRPGWACVVLAAGAGTRMNSRIPKPLHMLGGRSIVAHVLEAAAAAGVGPVTIVHDGGGSLPDALGDGYRYAVQPERDGTGGAVRAALVSFGESPPERVLVINGDGPFISPASLRALADLGSARGAVMAVLGAEEARSPGLGTVTLDGAVAVRSIVEAADRPDSAAAAGGPVNAGAYAFDAGWLRSALPELDRRGSGEYYVTDLAEAAFQAGKPAALHLASGPWEGFGVNTRADLAEAEHELRMRTLRALMLSGVTISDPATTYIDAVVSIGRDTRILPGTHLTGATRIGESCVIGPGAQIDGADIGDECRVWSSVIEGATLEDGVDVGPFSHLRPGAHLASGVHIGNYAEVKASRLGRDVAMGHFGYVGDADIGDGTNLGAGMVTCNFDGVDKHRTVVGRRAFIGSDTMLVAPVEVGDEASTGAGAVVTADVPPKTAVAGVPARPLRSGVRAETSGD